MSWRDDRHIRRALRTLVFARAGGHCEIRGPRCRHAGATCLGCAEELDHVVPRSAGGALYDPDNLRASCRPCNRGRSAVATNSKRRAAADPCGRHPLDLGVGEACPRCGLRGPSRQW